MNFSQTTNSSGYYWNKRFLRLLSLFKWTKDFTFKKEHQHNFTIKCSNFERTFWNVFIKKKFMIEQKPFISKILIQKQFHMLVEKEHRMRQRMNLIKVKMVEMRESSWLRNTRAMTLKQCIFKTDKSNKNLGRSN